MTSTFPRFAGDTASARFVFDLARALTAFYEVHVLAPHSPDASCEEMMDGIRVHRFRYFAPARLEGLTTGEGILAGIRRNKLLLLQLPFLFLSELVSLVKIVRREKIDIVNSHWIVPQGLAVAMVRGFLNVRHVMTIHAAGIFTLKRWGGPGRSLAKYITGRTDAVMPVSSYIKSTLDGLVGGEYRFKILPMGVDLGRFAKGEAPELSFTDSDSKKGLRILFVGKMAEKKGLKVLLDALEILRERNIPSKLTITGGGSLEKELKEHVSRKNMDKNVSFCGWVSNEKLPDFYASANITAVPSVFDRKGETEGMPVVVLESMAMGRPVLASRISGIPDIVEDGVNGWLVEPGSPGALADKLGEIHKMDLGGYKEAALRTAEKYSYEAIASGYKDVIDTL